MLLLAHLTPDNLPIHLAELRMLLWVQEDIGRTDSAEAPNRVRTTRSIAIRTRYFDDAILNALKVPTSFSAFAC